MEVECEMILDGTSSYDFDLHSTEQIKNFIKTVVQKQLEILDTLEKFNDLNKRLKAEIEKYETLSKVPNLRWIGIDLGTSTTCVAFPKYRENQQLTIQMI